MNTHPYSSMPARAPHAHELRFNSLFDPGRRLVIPCDASGFVDIDALSERQKVVYLGARALVGREYAYPVVSNLDRNAATAWVGGAA